MNKKLTSLLFVLMSFFGFSQSVIISPDNTAVPHASAILEIRSNNKGFLPPRLTEAERNAIASPALGLMIFNLTANKMQWYDGGKWSNIDGTTTKTTTELLTSQTWKIQELRWLDQGVMYYYLRGTPGNGGIVAPETLTFYVNGTGKTHDNTSLTWQFLDGAKTKLQFIVNFASGPVTVNWEHVVIKENSITYSEFWTRPTGPSVGFGTRIPL
jgi:hypothetical protein